MSAVFLELELRLDIRAWFLELELRLNLYQCLVFRTRLDVGLVLVHDLRTRLEVGLVSVPCI